jgi:hypothetical protein
MSLTSGDMISVLHLDQSLPIPQTMGIEQVHKTELKENAMILAELSKVADPTVAPSLGILAADKSSDNHQKRFEGSRGGINGR